MNENRKIAKMAEEVEDLEEVEESEGKGEKKKRGNTQFQLFMVTQDLAKHIGKDAKEINEAIEDRVGENLLWSYTSIHDGDTQSVWDFERKQFFDVEKLIHAHSVLRVKKKMTIKALADLIGIEAQYVERPKAGNGAELKMLAYEVHARDSDKKQYDPYKVVGSKDAIPYYEIYAKNKKQWDKDRALHRTRITEIDEDYIIEKIEEGEIVDKNQILLTDEYYRVYSRHNRRIDKALEIAAQRRQAKNAKDIQDGQLKSAIYVTGEPRKGKTYLCEKLEDKIREVIPNAKNWMICDANSDNCLDKYQGEEILFIDDARGNAMKANQWTRLLDPRRANQGSARYNDKLVSAKIIIFNSYYSVDEFFYFTKGIGERNKSEALDQFIGRILIKITVNGRDDVDLALSDCKPSTRYIEIENKHGDKERKEITTEHSFVTVCEHQTVANIVALTAGIIAANQHAGKVTDAMLSAIDAMGIPYNEELKLRANPDADYIVVDKSVEKELEKLKDECEEARARTLYDMLLDEKAYRIWQKESNKLSFELTDEDRRDIKEIKERLRMETACFSERFPGRDAKEVIAAVKKEFAKEEFSEEEEAMPDGIEDELPFT